MPRHAHSLAATLALVINLGMGAPAARAGAAASSGACDGCASLDGLVEYRPGEPAPLARVLVVDSGIRGEADARGRFHLAGIPAGEHRVLFHAPGSSPVSGIMRFAPAAALHDTVRVGLLGPGDEPVDLHAPGARSFSLGPQCGATAWTATSSTFRDVLIARGKLGDYWLTVDHRIPGELQVGYQLAAVAGLVSVEFLDGTGSTIDRFDESNQLGGDRTWEGINQRGDKLARNGLCLARFSAGSDVMEIPFCFEFHPPADFAMGYVDGTVVDSTGHPQAFMNVSVLGTRRGAATDAWGHFHIALVPAGDWILQVQPLGDAPVTSHVHVSAGGLTDVRLVLDGRRLPLNSGAPLIHVQPRRF